MNRKQVIAGNWKMYKTAKEGKSFLLKFLPQIPTDRAQVVICPPFTLLPCLAEALLHAPPNVCLGAQNIHWATEGAFTGEISGPMLGEYVSYAIVGHSERRHYFCETDATVRDRLRGAQTGGIVPILCVGETKLQREAGRAEEILTEQLTRALEGIDLNNLIVAYEPIWAIGTGDTCPAAEANRMLKHIRTTIGGDQVSLLYGGSVKPDNIDELMAQPEIDGVLVGGASLDPDSFARIVNFKPLQL